MEKYIIYKIKEEFSPCKQIYDTIYTDDIEESLNEFCENMGEDYLYTTNTLLCYNKFGNEFKFVKVDYKQKYEELKEDMIALLGQIIGECDLSETDGLQEVVENYYNNLIEEEGN